MVGLMGCVFKAQIHGIHFRISFKKDAVYGIVILYALPKDG